MFAILNHTIALAVSSFECLSESNLNTVGHIFLFNKRLFFLRNCSWPQAEILLLNFLSEFFSLQLPILPSEEQPHWFGSTAVFLRHSFLLWRASTGASTKHLKLATTDAGFFLSTSDQMAQAGLQSGKLKLQFLFCHLSICANVRISLRFNIPNYGAEIRRKCYFYNTRSVGDKCSLTTRINVYPLDTLGDHPLHGDASRWDKRPSSRKPRSHSALPYRPTPSMANQGS